MDLLFSTIEILIRPLFYLLFFFLVLQFVLKPFIKFLTVSKMIEEQKELHATYLEHKKKVKEERVKDREEREKRLLNT